MTFDIDLDSHGHISPYPGERPFGVDDQGFFFGRDAERAELIALCIENPAVILHGSAGSGKTSLLHAGLLPALREEGAVLPVSRAKLGSFFPQAALHNHNPHTLAVISAWSPDESPARLSRFSITGFLETQMLSAAWPLSESLVFAIIDQLEEVFVDAKGSQHRDDFFEELADALRLMPRLRVLLSIRSEYLSELAKYRQLLNIPDRGYVLLSALQRAAAVEAAVLPVEKAGYKFAPGAAEEIVDNLCATPISTSIDKAPPAVIEEVEPSQLQIVCSHIFQSLPSDASLVTLDFSDVDSYVDKILMDFCNGVVAVTAAEYEISAQRLREWLDQTFVTSRGTRQIVPEGITTTASMANSLIRKLENRHLLTAEWSSAKRWYSLANDRLISAIRQLRRPSQNEAWPVMDAADHLRAAVNIMTDGDMSLAEKHAWHALKTVESANLRLEADARSLLGNLAFKRGQLSIAEQQYRLAAELCEQLGDQSAVGGLIGAIGRMNAEQGRYIAALENLQSAVLRVPEDLTLRTELANALWRVGQAKAAAAIFGTVLGIEPGYTEALAGRGQIQAESGNASSALDDLGELQRLRPTARLEPEVQSAYALALARSGKPESAMEEATAALAGANDNGPILLRIARVATVTGAQDRALVLLHEAQKASSPALSFAQLDEAHRLLNSVQHQGE